jgi:serine/threonine-protein kinase RIO1
MISCYCAVPMQDAGACRKQVHHMQVQIYMAKAYDFEHLKNYISQTNRVTNSDSESKTTE